jgi:hypothetical protein
VARLKFESEAAIEKRREDAAVREEKLRAQLADAEEQRKAKQREFAEREAAKVERSAEVRRHVDEEFREKSRALQDKEAAATERYLQIEEAKQKRLEDARRAYENNSSSMQVKVAQIKKEQQDKNEQQIAAFYEREEQLAKNQRQREMERAKSALLARIDRERKAAAAARAEKQREAEKQMLNEIMAAKLKRIHDFQRMRDHIRSIANQKKLEAEQRRMTINGQMATMQTSGGSQEALMRQLASQFEIDIEELKARVQARRQKRAMMQSQLGGTPPRESSALPPLRPATSTAGRRSKSVERPTEATNEEDFDTGPTALAANDEYGVADGGAETGISVQDEDFE